MIHHALLLGGCIAMFVVNAIMLLKNDLPWHWASVSMFAVASGAVVQIMMLVHGAS